MGATLLEIYELVTNQAGLKGRMRLAVKTGISRIRAASLQDSKDTVSKFRTAATEILGVSLEEQK